MTRLWGVEHYLASFALSALLCFPALLWMRITYSGAGACMRRFLRVLLFLYCIFLSQVLLLTHLFMDGLLGLR